MQISTHALTWSATCCAYSIKKRKHFNSRAHVERDRQTVNLAVPIVISTHALTWSATCQEHMFAGDEHLFQLTRSRGARPPPFCFIVSSSAFQLTRSRGARPSRPRRAVPPRSFQLTRSRGARLVSTGSPVGYKEFQLTRSRGARPVSSSARRLTHNFNSRAHVERDRIILCRPAPQCISTHALTWSATVGAFGWQREHYISTHALTWSATLDVVAVGRLLHMIRIRSFLVCKISARCS